MRVLLEGEQRLRLQGGGGELEIQSLDPQVHFSPLHMLAASLASCTYAVLYAWGAQARLDTDALEIGVTWEYVEDPYRVGSFDMEIRWPGLSEARRAAALRVAEYCTVEQTLKQPPRIETRVQTEEGRQAAD